MLRVAQHHIEDILLVFTKSQKQLLVFLGNLINDSYKNNISSRYFCKKLEEYNITQIKTGAFTRGPTTQMIQKLNEIVNR